ncbi:MULTISPECIES: hypothetical protein [unclassified Brevibacillus]|uniref:hypothetical protein n=1 Tax=unclassified Brevibacillus TaxID=2684853 RepID=UPI003562E05D
MEKRLNFGTYAAIQTILNPLVRSDIGLSLPVNFFGRFTLHYIASGIFFLTLAL